MSSPKKRSMKDLKSISPSKCTNTRKVVYVQAGALADGTIAVVKAKAEGQNDREPFTNPARVAILNGMGSDGSSNGLLEAGFFMVGSMTINEDSDVAQRTSRGYDYKVFIASVDANLTGNSFAPLKALALRFCDFMNEQKDNKYERYALASEWNLTRDGAKPASCFILCDDAVKGIKMLFGQPLDPDNPDILILPRNWGRTNANVIALWFQMEKITAAHKVELCITGPDILEHESSDESE